MATQPNANDKGKDFGKYRGLMFLGIVGVAILLLIFFGAWIDNLITDTITWKWLIVLAIAVCCYVFWKKHGGWVWKIVALLLFLWVIRDLFLNKSTECVEPIASTQSVKISNDVLDYNVPHYLEQGTMYRALNVLPGHLYYPHPSKADTHLVPIYYKGIYYVMAENQGDDVTFTENP
jgi:MFS family permease